MHTFVISCGSDHSIRPSSVCDIPFKVQVGDMGVDGRIYPVGTKPAEAAAKLKKGQTD